MIYKDKLPRIEPKEDSIFYNEYKLIKEHDEKISAIMGNHRDPANEFTKKLIEFEQQKMIRAALKSILDIKRELYNNTGIVL